MTQNGSDEKSIFFCATLISLKSRPKEFDLKTNFLRYIPM